MMDLAVCDFGTRGFQEIREDIILAEMARRTRSQKEAIAIITPLVNKWLENPMCKILLFELYKVFEQDREPHTMEDALQYLDEAEQKPN